VQEGKRWYICESGWIKSWLAYTHYNKNHPHPGPIQNEYLLTYDTALQEWKPRDKLVPAHSEGPGNYRRVCQEVWDIYTNAYSESGPAIYVEKLPYHDTANWVVDQTPLPRLAAYQVRPPISLRAAWSTGASQKPVCVEQGERYQGAEKPSGFQGFAA
jgi:hypothetical protein